MLQRTGSNWDWPSFRAGKSRRSVRVVGVCLHRACVEALESRMLLSATSSVTPLGKSGDVAGSFAATPPATVTHSSVAAAVGTFTVPTQNATEGDGARAGLIQVATAPASDLVISLLSGDTKRITVPSSVTLPAGSTAVGMPFTVVDNAVLDGPQTVTVTVSAPGY